MSFSRVLLKLLPLLLAVITVFFASSLYAQQQPKDPKPAPAKNQEEIDMCMGCHSKEAQTGPVVDLSAYAKSPHKDMACKDCHSSITDAPHTPEMMKSKVACADCHPDEAEKFAASAHAKVDKVKGDHPTCVTCHSDNNNPHGIVQPAKSKSREQQVAQCSSCHGNAPVMNRYNVASDAVSSYEQSFHGKALLVFGNQQTAICSDCHGSHDVLSPTDPKSRTNRANADKLCSSPTCHPGAKTNFAMSGANHLRLKMRDNSVLAGIDLFFRGLTICVITFMLGGIALDLRSKVFGPKPPKCGRTVGLLIVLSFLFLVSAIGCATFSIAKLATELLVVAVGLLGVAYLTYFATRKPGEKPEKIVKYRRFGLTLRLQHIALMICFTTLIATGLPQRFASIEWLRHIYSIMGGLNGARYIHRIAAIGMIFTVVWHLAYLVFQWKKAGFKLSALTMVPTLKDAKDFIHVSMNYLGLRKDEPKFERYQFKQKMDYLAEYWGMPLMIITGFIMWYPIYWGNRLPEIALSAALVAHGWEATLAFLAIIAWHIYNEHFNPDTFPMSKVWITGDLTLEQMKHEHPLELERMDPDKGE